LKRVERIFGAVAGSEARLSWSFRQSEVLSDDVVWVIGFPNTGGASALFPSPRVPSFRRPSPEFDPRFILPFGASPSEFLRSSSPCLHFRRRTALPRVSALFATSLSPSHLSRDFPTPRYVPSLGFLNLPTVSSGLELRGLFHPRATSRVPIPVQGLVPFVEQPSSSEGLLPHCRWHFERSPANRLPPSMRLDFEALLPTKSGSDRLGD